MKKFIQTIGSLILTAMPISYIWATEPVLNDTVYVIQPQSGRTSSDSSILLNSAELNKLNKDSQIKYVEGGVETAQAIHLSPEPNPLPEISQKLGGACSYAGYLSVYVKPLYEKNRQYVCRVPKQEQFYGLEGQCSSGEILCNPLLFGLGADNRGFCAAPGKRATRSCESAYQNEPNFRPRQIATQILENPKLKDAFLKFEKSLSLYCQSAHYDGAKCQLYKRRLMRVAKEFRGLNKNVAEQEVAKESSTQEIPQDQPTAPKKVSAEAKSTPDEVTSTQKLEPGKELESPAANKQTDSPEKARASVAAQATAASQPEKTKPSEVKSCPRRSSAEIEEIRRKLRGILQTEYSSPSYRIPSQIKGAGTQAEIKLIDQQVNTFLTNLHDPNLSCDHSKVIEGKLDSVARTSYDSSLLYSPVVKVSNFNGSNHSRPPLKARWETREAQASYPANHFFNLHWNQRTNSSPESSMRQFLTEVASSPKAASSSYTCDATKGLASANICSTGDSSRAKVQNLKVGQSFLKVDCYSEGQACQKISHRLHEIKTASGSVFVSVSATVNAEVVKAEKSAQPIAGTALDNPFSRTLQIGVADSLCGETHLFASESAQINEESGMFSSFVIDTYSKEKSSYIQAALDARSTLVKSLEIGAKPSPDLQLACQAKDGKKTAVLQPAASATN